MKLLRRLAPSLLVLGSLLAARADADGHGSDHVLRRLPAGQWVEIHRQRPGEAVVFRRQPHAGSAFDTKRGRIVLFGSDTHAVDWTNSPLCFDVMSLKWTRAYPNDDPSTYRVSDEGLPVAGPDGAHPWAMHTFAAVTYDALNDRLVVASYPAHLAPGRFTNALAHVWTDVRRHPTWLFDLESKRWHPLPAPAVGFFPYATAYDSHRAVVVGYRPDGIYELSMADPRPAWRRVAEASLKGYHTNAVYDSTRRLILIAGSQPLRNDVVVYDPALRHDRVMPTPGVRPPPFQHSPMAFHERKGVLVVLVDRILDPAAPQDRKHNRAETWLYDASADAWSQVERATLPFALGMNYNMHYDPSFDVVLLVADEPAGATSVWALRLP